MTKCVAN